MSVSVSVLSVVPVEEIAANMMGKGRKDSFQTLKRVVRSHEDPPVQTPLHVGALATDTTGDCGRIGRD